MCYYSEATWASCHLVSPSTQLFVLQFVQVNNKESINSLVPGKFEWKFRYVIFKQISVNDGWRISCEIAQIWMSLDCTDDQSTLVQVMAWCHQCWPSSLPPYGLTRPQWGKPHYWPFVRESNSTWGFPTQKASIGNAESFSITWRHYETL